MKASHFYGYFCIFMEVFSLFQFFSQGKTSYFLPKRDLAGLKVFCGLLEICYKYKIFWG